MKPLVIASLLFLIGAGARADIYKCVNDATGELEFKDSPCSSMQTQHAVPDTVVNNSSRSRDEARAALVIMEDDRDDFMEVCEEQIDRQGLSSSEFNQRCEIALRKSSECKIKASRVMPAKVHAAYVRARADGLSEDDANELAKSPDNWGDMTEVQATELMMPIGEATRQCIQKVFN